jgi:DNA polymerase-3 subunit alpha
VRVRAPPSSLGLSHFSLLDGYGTPDEYARRWKERGGNYLCISDHGMLAGVPSQIKACEPSQNKDDPDFLKRSLSPIYACELYVNPLQIQYKNKDEWNAYTKSLPPEQAVRLRKSYHLLAIAYNETGYSNLVRLTSAAWLRGYYYRPRVNHELLMSHKEGLFFTSCCYNSEIGQAFETGGEEAAMAMVEKYIAMFGDKFRLELMLLDFTKQKPYDAFIIKAHQKYGIPLIVTNDTHYCLQEDSHYQRLMLMVQTQRTIQDLERAKAENDGAADFFELQDANLWMKTEEELNQKWEAMYGDVIDLDLFQQAKRNTVEICKAAGSVKLDRSNKLPRIDNCDEKLWEATLEGVTKRGIPKRMKYISRLREEYDLITRKDFSSYFLIQKMMTDEARRICPELIQGASPDDAVGPGRGSACGSLICYCLGITDVDPIKHDLLFSRFMSESRGGRQFALRFSTPPLPPEEEAA